MRKLQRGLSVSSHLPLINTHVHTRGRVHWRVKGKGGGGGAMDTGSVVRKGVPELDRHVYSPPRP